MATSHCAGGADGAGDDGASVVASALGPVLGVEVTKAELEVAEPVRWDDDGHAVTAGVQLQAEDVLATLRGWDGFGRFGNSSEVADQAQGSGQSGMSSCASGREPDAVVAVLVEGGCRQAVVTEAEQQR